MAVRRGVVFAALSGGVAGLSFTVDKNRPVSKVIKLLKDMNTQLEKDQEEDEKIYKKMECWCKVNDKEKTQAIKDAEAHIAEVEAAIEAGVGKVATLKVEIESLAKEVAENTSSLDKATALRKKQSAEFSAEEKDLLQSVAALKSALVVLEKHQGGALVQESDLTMVKKIMDHEMAKHKDLLDSAEIVVPNSFLQQPTFKQAYSSQSGEIFGILRNMQETFEADLSSSQKEELANQEAYTELKKAKQDEIRAGQAQLDTKKDEFAFYTEALANGRQDIIDTQNSLTEDEKFLLMVKEKCGATDQEWQERQKTRQEEMSAVTEALKFLSSDDAHDMFTRTFNAASFVQIRQHAQRRAATEVESATQKTQRERAASVLAQIPGLSMMAEKVRLDAFTKVKKAIDDMVVQLKKEKEDEIKHRDFCVSGFHENEAETTATTRQHEDLVASIEEMEANMKAAEGEVAEAQSQIANMNKLLKEAGEDREAANAEFQTTVQDQRDTVKLLNQALTVLKQFYDRKALLQTAKQDPPPMVGAPPPSGFKTYEENAGNSGVVAMITQIIHDAEMMEQEAIHDEKDGQATYEAVVQETNSGVDQKQRLVINKQEVIAMLKGDKEQASKEQKAAEVELEQLSNKEADLHKSCDYVVKNFDVRQEARDEEIEALGQAKAILSGADFAGLQVTEPKKFFFF